MSQLGGSGEGTRALPLVAVVSAVPMLREALADLDEIVEVHGFPAGRDTAGLLRWLAPDAVVVDSELEAEEATAYARESGAPLLRISYADAKVYVLETSGWVERAGAGLSPEDIRNIVVGSLFGRVTRGAPAR